MYSRAELFMCSLECYFGVYFSHCCATQEINTKITLSLAYKQFATEYIHYSIYVCVLQCVNQHALFLFYINKQI